MSTLAKVLYRYLIRSQHINPTEVEYDLAILSISYLSLPEVAKGREDCEIEKALLQGFFSFYEYAVPSWVFHLEAGISILSKELLDQLAEALEVFLDLHWADSSEELVVSKAIKDKLQPLKDYDIYNRLAQAVMSTRKQLGRHGQGPSDDEILDLSTITAEVRTVLEKTTPVSTDLERQLTLERFYGPNRFKCPRINCQYFYKGFPKFEHRQQHVARHDRAFLCYFEGCPTSIFGCSFLKELKDHMFNDHGIDVSDDLEFPRISLPLRQQKHPSTFQCEKCPKCFTRKHNLVAHLRVHEGDKPFTCGECGLSFTRENDKKRHEALHGGEKTFVCKGTLTSGDEWGCGLSFLRADKLSSHHKSATGSRCIRPLLEQEAEAKKKLEDEERAVFQENYTRKTGQVLEVDSMSMNPQTLRPFPESMPMIQAASVESTSSNEDKDHCHRLAIENLAPLMPNGGSEDTHMSRQNSLLSMDPLYSTGGSPDKAAISLKTTYQRPKHHRVFCKQCDHYPEGFRGEHELRRHQDREHKRTIKKWVCVQPSDGFSHPEPELALSRCKACWHQKKKYMAYYNAAAHLRRAHFKPKNRVSRKGSAANVEKRGGKGGGDWPPMSELKYWMKEVEEVVVSSHDNSEDLDDDNDDNDNGWGNPQAFASLDAANFETSFNPSLNETPLNVDFNLMSFPNPSELITGFGDNSV